MGDVNIYAGADYGLDPNYKSEYSLGVKDPYKFKAGSFGLTTDARSANQLAEVSKKLNTGAKVIEVTAISPEILDYIPEQHLTEINRLRKLAGVNLTFHGPLIEPTGVTRQGWDESQREQAEREMWTALKRAHKIDPEGNVVVTFHSSNWQLPDPENRVKTEVIDPITKERKMKEQIKEVIIVNEKEGNFQKIDFPQDYFRGKENVGSLEDQEKAIKLEINKQNSEIWNKKIQELSFHAHNGYRVLNEALQTSETGEEEAISKDNILNYYKEYISGEKKTFDPDKLEEPYKSIVKDKMYGISHGDAYLRDAYQGLQNLYNQAYSVAKLNNAKDDVLKLNEFRQGISSKLSYLDSKDPSKFLKFAEEIEKGVIVLKSINPPETFKPLRDFAVDKSAKTFANMAFNAYSEFKDTAPIISIENPPAGTGLTRARDLRDVVNKSRDLLTNRFIEEKRSNLFSCSAFCHPSLKKQIAKCIFTFLMMLLIE